MAVADGVPEMVEVVPRYKFPDSSVTNPLVSWRLPFIIIGVFTVTPALLVISIVEFVLVVKIPVPEIDCAPDPFNATVPALAGAKFSVPPEATRMFPLMEWPGVPVILKLMVPFVMVRLSIETAAPPVGVTDPPTTSISKLA